MSHRHEGGQGNLNHKQRSFSATARPRTDSVDPGDGSRQSRPVNNGGVAVTQRTRNQEGTRTSSSGGAVRTEAVLTEDHEENDIVIVPMSRRWLTERIAGEFAAGDEKTMVSKQAGPSLPPTDMHSSKEKTVKCTRATRR